MPRKPKPLYRKLAVSGENTHLRVEGSVFANPRSYHEGNGLIISPYSEYIPLLYLFCTRPEYNWQNNVSQSIFKNLRGHLNGYTEWGRKYTNSLFYNLAYQNHRTEKRDYLMDIQEAIKGWMYFDGMISVDDIFGVRGIYGTDRESTIRNINTFTRRMYQRSYNCRNSVFTSFLEEDYPSEKWNPELLAVILPENYLYMKYNLLVNNTIDLSKVIILINRELDTPQFEKKAYRKFYREAFLPHIMKSSCDVWEVPKEFITEKCFLGDISFKGMNLIEKRKQTDEMIKQFCEDFVNKYGEGGGENVQLDVDSITQGNAGIIEQLRNPPIEYYTYSSEGYSTVTDFHRIEIQTGDRVMALEQSLIAAQQALSEDNDREIRNEQRQETFLEATELEF